jgi:hypothetical protein
LYESYQDIGIQLHLTYCKRAVLKTLKKLSFNEKFDYELIYPSNDDAVHNIMLKTAVQQHEESLVSMGLDPSSASMPEFDAFANNNNHQRLKVIEEHPTLPTIKSYDNNTCISIDIEEAIQGPIRMIDDDLNSKDIEYPASVYKKRTDDVEIDILD